jgi:Protein of unknown function (DUF3810)
MAKRTNKDNRDLKLRGITILSLALAGLILMLLADHPSLIEHYYSHGLYPIICHVFHPVFNIFPFSVGDLFYMTVIGCLLYTIIRLIRLLIKRNWGLTGIFLLNVTIGVQIFVLAFYLFWGMNYYRPSAAIRLNLPDSGYSTDDLKLVTTVLIDSANASRAKIGDAELHQDNKAIYKTAIKAVNFLSDSSSNFYTYNPNIKSSLLTPLLNYIGTSGYYNPFTAEAQINYQMPVFLKPFVACHEMSHQMGYGPEDEANFVGFIAGIRSPDRLLRYSAYYVGVQEFMFALQQQDSVARKELKKRISPLVINDFKAERTYWTSYAGKAEVLTSLFYDNFLKANNQPQGLRTYNQMIRLVMGWYRKKFIVHG